MILVPNQQFNPKMNGFGPVTAFKSLSPLLYYCNGQSYLYSVYFLSFLNHSKIEADRNGNKTTNNSL